MQDYDIIIVGAGPAGSAAAIHIANLQPEVARRTLILEKAVFPRHKLCGGGVTTHADAMLARLGLSVDVPSFPIHAARILFRDISFTIRWHNLFRVVRREEFDAGLAKCALARGVEIREGEAVIGLERDPNGVTVQTRGGEFRTRVVIGADGANSEVRRQLGLVRWDRISRLMETLTPVQAERTAEFAGHTAVFDFTPVVLGVQGYYWDFPSVKQGVPMMNRGMFDSRARPERPRPPLKDIFDQSLAQRRVEREQVHLQGHPERWFDPSLKHSAPRVLLAGDAAGTEPLLGEGISHALDFGMMAAESALRALRREDYAFADYERRVAISALGRRLWYKRALAQFVYAPHPEWMYRLGFGVLRVIVGN